MESDAIWICKYTFNISMNETLESDIFVRCLVFIDDVCIYSKTFEQHPSNIKSVFNKLEKFNWKLKLKKCKFAQTKIEILGHVISENQIEVLKKNLEKLMQIHG